MSEINDLIRKIRGKDSLRKANDKTGISYTYWSILEKGVDPRTHAPISPTPDTLRAISKGYNYPYEELMKVAGYLDEDKEESESTLPKSKIDEIVKRVERKLNVTLSDDPLIMESLENYLTTLANVIKNKK
ncbi:helix-turn-helix domain-containing protein [Cohnella zeiphila]|uniref:Helix-turn-helix transcriptional regulator n=1 Tax=Cohnella zeiphila TaxID=2761120 RepID=A0A7X0SQA3_9BACL|nr:helix-turn-helix transcriptional regulator [Cohnella zeiphila]MBB6731928.1 helix-turn-helix transcriptional regulator [Cohnella zeiphila]